MRIGFLGAGRMGAPMARRLRLAGHAVHALARSADKRDALAAAGICADSSIATTVAEADLVIVCAFNDAQVHEICSDSGLFAAMPRGGTLVVHTTGSPRTAEALAAEAEPYGIDVLDAPVSGGPPDIDAGALTLFVGGEVSALDRVRPAISAYGNPILHVGPVGSGQRVKLINNAAFAAQIGLLRETVRFATQLGVDEATLLRALPHGSATSRALDGAVSRGSVDGFRAAVGDFLAKDVSVVRAVADELGGDLGLLDEAIDRP
ncbi:NAD(P)-dependent oxidoreductase [Nocardia goodfellowii]